MVSNDLEFQAQQILDLKKGVLEFSYILIRSLILVNGGAIIAILTLVGTAWQKETLVIAVLPNILYFNTGIILALACCLTAYCMQVIVTEYFTSKFMLTIAGFLRLLAIIFAMISIAAFAFGSHQTINAAKQQLESNAAKAAGIPKSQ